MEKKLNLQVKEWKMSNQARGLSYDSLETYGNSAKHFSDFFVKSLNIYDARKITSRSIQEYIIYQQELNCKEKTINNRLKALRAMLNSFKQTNKKYILPTIKMLSEPENIKEPLTDEEVIAIINNIDITNTASVMAAVILGTGIRSKTLRNIKAEDIYFERAFLSCKITKNKKILTLPIPKALLELLGAFIKKEGLVPSSYLFRNKKGTKLYDRSAVYKLIIKFLKKCNIKKTGVHLFRYTFGRIMIENNCNPMILQQWLGHTNFKETQKYVRIFSNELVRHSENVTPLSANSKTMTGVNSLIS